MTDKSTTNNYELTSTIGNNYASIKWMIKKFSLHAFMEDKRVTSPEFSSSGDSTWKLALMSDGNFLAITLIQTSSKCEEKKVSCKISIKDNNEVDYFVRKGVYDFSVGYIYTIITVRHDELLNKKREELLPNDTLTIFCELNYGFTIRYSSVIETKRKEPVSPDVCLNKLATDFRRVFDDQKYCDVVLFSSDGEKFPVHKAILEARSSVFSTMLQSDMIESRQGEVCIEDIDSVILKQLLHYVYTAEVNETFDRDVLKLYAVADKYDIDSLKQKCKHHILDNMSVDNVCDAMVLADMFSDKELKELANDIISKDATKVLTSEIWKQFEEEHPSLAAKAVRVIVLQNKM